MKGDNQKFWRLSNASIRPPGDYNYTSNKRRPGAFTMWPGRILEKKIGHCRPPGRYKKASTKHPPNTYWYTATAQQQQLLVMSHPSSTDKAPSTNKSADEHSNSWGSLRHPREAAPTRGGTPAPARVPAPAPAAQVVQRVPLPRVYPPSFVGINRGFSGAQWGRRGGTPTP